MMLENAEMKGKQNPTLPSPPPVSPETYNMFQRWYFPETGTFVSKAPYPPRMEHGYNAYMQVPSKYVDPRGEQAIILIHGFIKYCQCVFLSKKMKKYQEMCDKELDQLIEKYKEFSETPVEEAYIEFIGKYTDSGPADNITSAMLGCMASKGRENGDDGLVAKWITKCGFNLPLRAPSPK